MNNRVNLYIAALAIVIAGGSVLLPGAPEFSQTASVGGTCNSWLLYSITPDKVKYAGTVGHPVTITGYDNIGTTLTISMPASGGFLGHVYLPLRPYSMQVPVNKYCRWTATIPGSVFTIPGQYTASIGIHTVYMYITSPSGQTFTQTAAPSTAQQSSTVVAPTSNAETQTIAQPLTVSAPTSNTEAAVSTRLPVVKISFSKTAYTASTISPSISVTGMATGTRYVYVLLGPKDDLNFCHQYTTGAIVAAYSGVYDHFWGTQLRISSIAGTYMIAAQTPTGKGLTCATLTVQ